MAGGARETFDAESLLRALMENVPGAIYGCVLDDIWNTVRVSDEIESISGCPASDFIEASVGTLASVIIFDVTEQRAAERLRRERETEAARIARDLRDGARQRLVAASIQPRTSTATRARRTRRCG